MIVRILAVAAFVLPACAPVSADRACSEVAAAECAKQDECRHNATLMYDGDLATCVQVHHDMCMAELASDGTGKSPDIAHECAGALPTMSCQSWLQGAMPSACTPSGTLDDGEGCAFDTQCSGGFCSVSAGDSCGTCAELPAAGDPCFDAGCGPNMTCAADGTCEPFVAVGGACDKTKHGCAPNSWCVIASGAQSGTCQASGMELGAPCDSKKHTAPGCDFNDGLYCSATTQKCVAIDYAEPGAACGPSDHSGSSTWCLAANCIASTCVALAKDGEPCDLDSGLNCVSPERCVVAGSGTSGVCEIPDAASCGE
jgi:hypothetical protein